MLGGSQNKGARSSCNDGLLESSSASMSTLQKATSTPTGSLSEISVTAVRQGIHSGKLNSLIYMGKMEGIHKKKWHRTVHVLWCISRQQPAGQTE